MTSNQFVVDNGYVMTTPTMNGQFDMNPVFQGDNSTNTSPMGSQFQSVLMTPTTNEFTRRFSDVHLQSPQYIGLGIQNQANVRPQMVPGSGSTGSQMSPVQPVSQAQVQAQMQQLQLQAQMLQMQMQAPQLQSLQQPSYNGTYAGSNQTQTQNQSPVNSSYNNISLPVSAVGNDYQTSPISIPSQGSMMAQNPSNTSRPQSSSSHSSFIVNPTTPNVTHFNGSIPTPHTEPINQTSTFKSLKRINSLPKLTEHQTSNPDTSSVDNMNNSIESLTPEELFSFINDDYEYSNSNTNSQINTRGHTHSHSKDTIESIDLEELLNSDPFEDLVEDPKVYKKEETNKSPKSDKKKGDKPLIVTKNIKRTKPKLNQNSTNTGNNKQFSLQECSSSFSVNDQYSFIFEDQMKGKTETSNNSSKDNTNLSSPINTAFNSNNIPGNNTTSSNSANNFNSIRHSFRHSIRHSSSTNSIPLKKVDKPNLKRNLSSTNVDKKLAGKPLKNMQSGIVNFQVNFS